MKTIAGELAFFLRGRARQNLKVLLVYCSFLVLMILLYAVLFQHLMLRLEGREHSFIAETQGDHRDDHPGFRRHHLPL